MEFFQFMRKLLTCNAPYVQPQPGHDKLVRIVYLVQKLKKKKNNNNNKKIEKKKKTE